MGLSLITLALAKKNTKVAVEAAIRQAEAYTDEVVSHLISFTIEIVESLPDPSEAKEHVIYFVPKPTPSGGSDYYEEYIWLNNKWELIGSTELDLSNYWTIDQVKEYVQSQAYTLPIATTSTLGGVKIDNVSIKAAQDGTVSIIDSYVSDNAQTVIDENFEHITDNEINDLFS